MLAANQQRMLLVTNRLKALLNSGCESIQQLEQPLLGLTRSIDYLVAKGEVPSEPAELCLLVKEICQRRGDSLLLPLIMALMVSVKYASQLGWFTDADTKDIINLYKEISSSFSLPQNFDDEKFPSNPHIRTVMDRFLPQLSLGNVLAYLEVKPGYGAYVVDFPIPKDDKFLPKEKIQLFVAQTDITETSACLISPQQANFLLNGKGIVGRVCTTLDTGPQIPTNVTTMLKFGVNLLQVVGHFSDSDVIMGSSRVCLNCPISRKRIETPVKGKSCRHVQCFDFGNYVEINSRRPSWCCPHCNNYISFLDVRVDNTMVKVLKEVGDNVEDVVISPDGSWKADALDMLDLTMESDVMDMDQIHEFEDRIPSQGDLLNPKISNVEMPTVFNTSNQASDTRASQMDDDIWSGLGLPGYSLGPSNDGYDNQLITNTFHPTGCAPNPLSQLPVLPGVNGSRPQSVNSALENQFVRVASVPPNVARAPISVQALASTNGTPNLGLSSGAIPASVIPSGMSSQSSSSIASNAHGSTTSINSEVEKLREYSRSVLNRLQLPEMNLRLSQRHSMTQSRDAMQSNIHNSSTQTAASGSTSQSFNPQRMASVYQAGHQNRLNPVPPQFVRHPNVSAGMVQTQSHPLRTDYQQARAEIGASCSSILEGTPLRHIITPRPAFQPLRQQAASAYQNQTLLPYQLNQANIGVSAQHPQGPVQQVSRIENLVNLSVATNMKPAGRMRGSLSGTAYEEAFNHFMAPGIRESQGALRTPTSPGNGVPPELHEMITNLSASNNTAPTQ